jgi:hypothetical protein
MGDEGEKSLQDLEVWTMETMAKIREGGGVQGNGAKG